MPTRNDRNTITISVRSAVAIAIASALASGAAPSCTGRQDEIVERLDRVERIMRAEREDTDRRLTRLERGY